MSPRMIERSVLTLLCGLLAAEGAYAFKSDKQQPINIQADHADFRADPSNNSNGTGIYTGHVVITQGSIMLTADKAVLHVINNEMDTADIEGKPATFQQQPDNGGMIHGYADEITYDASKNQMDLITNARLLQPVNQVNGVVVAAPPGVTAHSPGSATASAASYATQGERLMSADHIRYNTETQRMLATAGKDEGRVHITFPPKQLPGGNADADKARKPDASVPQAPAAATHPAAVPAATTHPGDPT